MVVVPIFAVIASVDALRRALPGSAARSRARAFLTAFLVRDATFLFMVLGSFGTKLLYGNWEYMDWRRIPHRSGAQVGIANEIAFPILIAGILAYVPLLAYGVLKTQLFDIGVKIKAGVKASVLTLFFLVAFFAAEQVGQALISERAGPYVGIAGAGLLTIAIEPLRRALRDALGEGAARAEASVGSPAFLEAWSPDCCGDPTSRSKGHRSPPRPPTRSSWIGGHVAYLALLMCPQRAHPISL